MGLQNWLSMSPKRDTLKVSRARLPTLANIGNVALYLERANSKISLFDPGSIFPKSLDGNANISRPSCANGNFVESVRSHVDFNLESIFIWKSCDITLFISITMSCEIDNIPQNIPKYFPHSYWMWEISKNILWNIVSSLEHKYGYE